MAVEAHRFRWPPLIRQTTPGKLPPFIVSLPPEGWLEEVRNDARPLRGPNRAHVALIPMPDGMPPALLVERFDIPESTNDRRMLALENLCSVLNLSPS